MTATGTARAAGGQVTKDVDRVHEAPDAPDVSGRGCGCSCAALVTQMEQGPPHPSMARQADVNNSFAFCEAPTALSLCCGESGVSPAAPCGPATDARTEGMWGMEGTGGTEYEGDNSLARRRVSGARDAVGTLSPIHNVRCQRSYQRYYLLTLLHVTNTPARNRSG